MLILKAIQVMYTVEYSRPFMGDAVPKLNRHMTTTFAGRHILTVVMLSPRSKN
jgi:hypothetical protein